MNTKYIVNNASGQTISGNLTINGNVTITGSSNSNSIATYKALLTQTGELVGSSINDFNAGLIIGETYTITNYFPIDDFSNIANVQSGNINETGCVFIATGSTPNTWKSGSILTSDGGLIVNVLENTLGYDLDWSWNLFGQTGIYLAVNDTTGPLINSFPRNNTYVTANVTTSSLSVGDLLQIYGGSVTIMEKDDAILIGAWNFDIGGPTDNALYYTPVEITIKQDLDTTPLETYGLNDSSLPYGNISVRLFAGEGNNVATFYNENEVVANSIEELVAALNADAGTNFLGTYSVNLSVEGGVILTMATNLKNQFSPNNTLTFEVFND